MPEALSVGVFPHRVFKATCCNLGGLLCPSSTAIRLSTVGAIEHRQWQRQTSRGGKLFDLTCSVREQFFWYSKIIKNRIIQSNRSWRLFTCFVMVRAYRDTVSSENVCQKQGPNSCGFQSDTIPRRTIRRRAQCIFGMVGELGQLVTTSRYSVPKRI